MVLTYDALKNVQKNAHGFAQKKARRNLHPVGPKAYEFEYLRLRRSIHACSSNSAIT